MTLLDNESYLKAPDMEASVSTVSTTSGEDYDFLSNPSDYDYDESSLDEMETHSVLSTDRDDEYGRMSDVFPPTPPHEPALPEELEAEATAQDILENPDLSTVSLSNSNSTLRMPLIDSSLIASQSLSPCSPRVLLRGLAAGPGAAHDAPDAVGDFKAQIGLGRLQVIAFGDDEVVPGLVEHVKKVLEIGERQWAAYYGSAGDKSEFYELSKGVIEDRVGAPTVGDDFALCLAYYTLDPLDHTRITARLDAIDQSIPVIPVIQARPGEKMAELLNDIKFHHTAPIDYDEELKSLVPYTAQGFVQLDWKDFRRVLTAQWAQRRQRSHSRNGRSAVLAVMAGLWVLVLAISGASWYSRSVSSNYLTSHISSDSHISLQSQVSSDSRPEITSTITREIVHTTTITGSSSPGGIASMISIAAASASSMAARLEECKPSVYPRFPIQPRDSNGSSRNSSLTVPEEAPNGMITREKGPAEVVQRDPSEVVAGDVPVFVSSIPDSPDKTVRRSRPKSSPLEYAIGKGSSAKASDTLSTGMLQSMYELLDVIFQSVSQSAYELYTSVRLAIDNYEGDYISLLKSTGRSARSHSRSIFDNLSGRYRNAAAKFRAIDYRAIDDQLLEAEKEFGEKVNRKVSQTTEFICEGWYDYDSSQVKVYIDGVEQKVAFVREKLKPAASNAREHVNSVASYAQEQIGSAASNAREHLESASSSAREYIESAASKARASFEENRAWAQEHLNKRSFDDVVRRLDKDTAVARASLEEKASQAVARARDGRDKLSSWYSTHLRQSALRRFNRFKDQLRAMDKSQDAVRDDYRRLKKFMRRSNDRFRVVKSRAAKQSHRLRARLLNQL